MTRRRSLATGVLSAILLASGAAHAVLLDADNKCSVVLADGTRVELYGEFVSGIGQSSSGAGLGQPSTVIPALSELDTMARGQALRNAQFDTLRAAQQRMTPGFAKHERSNRFHYLPPDNSLRLSKREDGTPKFLFVRYTTDDREEAGGTQGGLFHFLMEWGLSPQQDKDLRAAVTSQCSEGLPVGTTAELIGAVPLEEAATDSSFRIISAVLSDDGLTRSIVQSGRAPTLPGGKVAAAANLSADGAQLFLATVEKSQSIADLSIQLDFAYNVMVPGARGEVIFHWDRLQEHYDELLKQGTNPCHSHFKSLEENTNHCHGDDIKDETHESEIDLDTLLEQKIVELRFEGYQPDAAYNQTIIAAMMDYFKNSLTEPSGIDELSGSGLGDEEAFDEGDAKPQSTEDYGAKYFEFSEKKLKSVIAQKEEIVHLDFGVTVKREFSVVGNLASWYQSVKDNRKCVQSVNLNDPFFQHRDIRFILDLEAKEIFEEMVNYVTVNVKKPRKNGADFYDSITIDREYLGQEGATAAVTYARGEDRNSELYKYQMQWSLKGGNLYPASPRWERGRWEGVTLATPVEKWLVQAEADLLQMQESDIARVSVELRYPLFGEEQSTTFALAPTANDGQPIIGRNIFVDRGTKGFAYRTMVHHKKHGRMVVPCDESFGNRCEDGWRVGIGERYVYARVPQEMLDDPTIIGQAKQAAQRMGQTGVNQVLQRFQDLLRP